MTRLSERTWPNLLSMFFDQVEENGDAPFLWAKEGGDSYLPQSWRRVAARISKLAGGLRAAGVRPGERVILVSENRPEWLIADLAIIAAGAITVPAYVTNTTGDHRHIVRDSGASAAIVSTKELAENLLPAAHEADALKSVITMERPEIYQGLNVNVISWDEVVERGGAVDENIDIRPGDVACIIYTSGTGGAPKGVMLSHRAILHNCYGARAALMELGLGAEVFLSFLPLSHSYEHSAGQFFPISIGAQIYYAEGIDSLGANMIEVRPTIMTAVPRLYETLHQRITLGVKKAGGMKEKMFRAALELGRERYLRGGKLSLAQGLKDRLLDKLVRDKVRARFGGRLKALVSGGAPLNPDIGLFFTALGLRILQGYGQTEAAPVISVNRPGLIKIHTVGPALKDTEIKIAEDGEILVRGDLIMEGYWRNEAATAKTIIDGWLHTGDIGELDQDGYLTITDRKKDIIVNSGGDNLSPQRVEGFLAMEPEIAQAMVYGDKRPHLVGLLVPDPDWLEEWAAAAGKAPYIETLADDPDFRKVFNAALERVNEKMSLIEKVRRVAFADGPFTIEGGMLTPTMKIRRHKIKEVYRQRLEELYV
jgi:long-chain acyl-CoA synthetase